MYFELPLQSQAIHYGSLAQLVQSVCLTSRGSGVRIPQLPRLKINDLQRCKSFFRMIPIRFADFGCFRAGRRHDVGISDRDGRLRVHPIRRIRRKVRTCRNRRELSGANIGNAGGGMCGCCLFRRRKRDCPAGISALCELHPERISNSGTNEKRLSATCRTASFT